VDHLARRDAGAVLVLMELVVCQESLELRVTVASTGFLVCPATRECGVRRVEWDHQGLPERMERGETMETWDPEVFQVNQDLVVCWVLKAPLVFLDLLVCVETMVLMVLKETWDPRESLAHLGSRVNQELRECQDLRGLTDLQERRDPEESLVCQECPVPTDLQATQERRGQVALKATWDQVVLRVLLAILVLGESRVSKESVD